MQEIKTIRDIQSLARKGFADWQDLGYVSVKNRGDLMIFNYTPKAQFEGRWNYFEKVSRGLILNNQTGEVVARPFDKFFNWGEGDRSTDAPILNITEKMDGSLGILYRDNGSYHIATRGSFGSDQALWATEFLDQNFDLEKLSEDLTLLFEIIYPDNRVVINYQDKKDLVLLAARNRKTGKYMSWRQVKGLSEIFGFSLPKVYHFSMVEDIVRAKHVLDVNSEGWVVEFEDGQRFKFKGQEYLRLHKLISGLSFKNTLECIANDSLDELRELVPDEFLNEVNKWVEDIQQTVEKINQDVDMAFEGAPKQTRKDFALWVMTHHKSLASYMFSKLDNRPIDPLIYKSAFKNIV